MTPVRPDPRGPRRLGRPRADDAPGPLARRRGTRAGTALSGCADLDADEILEALSDDVMAEGDLAEALRRLMERGWRSGDPTRPDLAGLQRPDGAPRAPARGSARALRPRRRPRRHPPRARGHRRRRATPAVERRLQSTPRKDAARPRHGPRRRSSGGPRRRRLDRLDALPPDLGERIRALPEYDFLEPDARQRFDELVERLGKQVLDQFVAGMSDAIRSMTPEDLAANREMVRDLNELIRERIGGHEPDVREFLAKHGRFFPGAQTLDDIIEQLAQRMAAMQSLMRSMSPEQRAELESMMEALLRDDRLLIDLAQLARTSTNAGVEGYRSIA